jgi:hypothetical protein
VGVKIMAGIQCFFGGIGVLYTPFSVFQGNLARDPVSRAMHDAMWSGPAAIWFGFSILIGTLLAGALLASGIGLFWSKRWARTLGLVYGAGALVMLVCGQIAMLIVVYPVLTPFVDSTNPVERAGAIGGLIGGVFGSFLGAILPVAMLIVLGRKAIVPQLRD